MSSDAQNAVAEGLQNSTLNSESEFGRTLTPRPWHRWFARTIDLWVSAAVLGFAVAIFGFPGVFDNRAIATIVAALLALIADTVLMPTVGATFGKALLNLRVRESNGKMLDWRRALQRAIDVWFHGEALGIPIVSLFTMSNQHQRLKRDGITSYDSTRGFRITHGEIDLLRIAGPSLPYASTR